MPAVSQKQEKFMNWVHAVQKGEAKGKGKALTVAKEMKPSSVEHFMGRGHIDKDLPKKAGLLDYVRALSHNDNEEYEKKYSIKNYKLKKNHTPDESRRHYLKLLREGAKTKNTYSERLSYLKDAPYVAEAFNNAVYGIGFPASLLLNDTRYLTTPGKINRKASNMKLSKNVGKVQTTKVKQYHAKTNKPAFNNSFNIGKKASIEKGFVKAATQHGLSEGEAIDLFKLSSISDDMMKAMPGSLSGGVIGGGVGDLLGSGLGAGAGSVAGYQLTNNLLPDKFKKEHGTSALIMKLLGGGASGLLGARLGGYSGGLLGAGVGGGIGALTGKQ